MSQSALQIGIAAAATAAVVLALRRRLTRRKPGTLWASPISTCSRRVVLALEEAGAEYAFKPINLAKKEQKAADFVAMQPYGKVPVWQEDGLILFESRAIMKHVARGSSLIPTDAALAAQVEQWISVEYSYFYPEFLPIYIYFERVLKKMYQPGVGPDETLCEAKTKALLPTLDLLEQHLQQSTGPYLVGPFSLADITFMPYTFQFGPCGLQPLLDERPALATWVTRCLERPAWVYATTGRVMERAVSS